VGAAGQGQGVALGVWELAGFIGLAGVLDLMVVPVAGGGSAAASFAVFFGGLLVVGAGPTACVAALAGVWSEGMVRRRPGVRVGFDAGHSVLSLLAAGWLYRVLGGEVGRLELPGDLPGVVGAAVTLWLLEAGWVAVAVGLERGGRLWGRLAASLGPMLALDGALASVGLLLALLYGSGWQLIGEQGQRGGLGVQEGLLLAGVTLVPSGLLYYAYRLQRHLAQVYAQSLRTLGALMEAKLEGRASQPGQPGHGERVAAVAAGMAQALELPAKQVDQIRYAGYLHDIGKVGVPTELLHRSRDQFRGEPGPLRLHPQLGAQILGPIRFLGLAAETVRAHHERWDGLGYPEGLRQEAIPLGARLLALADAYVRRLTELSALCAANAEPALSGDTGVVAASTALREQVLASLRMGSGSRYDPRLVDLLAQVLSGCHEFDGAQPPSEAVGDDMLLAGDSRQVLAALYRTEALAEAE